MYNLLNFDHILKGKPYFAHTDETGKRGKEPLIDHMNLTIKYFNDYYDKKHLSFIIGNLIKKSGFTEDEFQLIIDFFVNAIYSHDIGKINPSYQRNKMDNKKFKPCDSGTEHSIYSSYIYISEVLKKFRNINRRCLMALFSFAFVISCHHGKLSSVGDFEDKLKACSENDFYTYDFTDIMDSTRYIGLTSPRMKKLFPGSIAFFILLRLLFSLITACDFCATSEYKNQTNFEISVINNIEQFESRYYESKLLKKIKTYRKKEDIKKINSINELRTEIFLDAEKSLYDNLLAKIYYLEAPTGSGKTNTSINLALKLLENDKILNNIFYIFPFNTLVEQTANTLHDYFTNEEMAVINSVTPVTVDDKEEVDYDSLWMNRLFNNYPLVVTTHVNFFNILFGTGREQIFPLVKLCNSIVIIDEIQSYKNQIWPEIIKFLSNYADLLNIRIIIMSATLPRLDKVFGTDSVFSELLADSRKYYKHPIFKNRVKIDTSLMKDDGISLSDLADHVLANENKKVLIEFITKSGARDFYNIIKVKAKNRNFYELSGDDCSLVRKDIINKTKESKSIILIATQVIEAGIDIDMDIGYKEVSLPDAEEQFMGRINRSCEKSGCIAYFFNYTKPEAIYKGDCRVNYSINDKEILKFLENKDFMAIYSRVLEDLKDYRTKPNALNISRSVFYCQTLDFKSIENKMQLINPSMQIYIPYILKQNDKKIDGYEIWNEYKQICTSLNYSYSKKKVLMLEVRAKMDPFIFNLINSKDESIGLHLEEFGGIYFVDGGERFIKEEKFNRKEFNSYFRGRFL